MHKTYMLYTAINYLFCFKHNFEFKGVVVIFLNSILSVSTSSNGSDNIFFITFKQF